MTENAPAVSTDLFLGGRITLLQLRGGHRAGLDAALLQALVPREATGTAVDLGTGVGTVAFCMAARAPGLRCVGIERDAATLRLAEAALRLPGNAVFADRVRLWAGEIGPDLLAGGEAALPRGSADWVLMNPPFDEPGTVRPSPAAGKREAYLADPSTLETWTANARALLRPGGRLGLVHRPAALPRILGCLSGLGDIRVLPVHPRAGEDARRVLVVAKAASRAPLRLLPGLVLHGTEGWTAEAAAILDGSADLAERAGLS